MLEKIFKNRFKNKKSLEGIDADELWGAIAENIESKPIVLESNKPSMSKWAIILLFLLCSSLFYLYFSNNTSSPKHYIETSNIAIANKEKTNALENLLSEEDIFCNDIEGLNTNQTPTALGDNNYAFDLKKESAIIEGNKISKSGFKQNTQMSNLAPAKKEGKVASVFLKIDKENSELARVIKKQLLEDRNIEQLQKSIIVDCLETLNYKEIDIVKDKFHLPQTAIILASALPKKSKHAPLEISINAGANTVFTKYRDVENKADLFKDLSNSLSNNIGFSTTAKISYLFNEKYSISSGFSYNLTNETFERSSEKNSTFLEENYLMTYELNPVGDTINALYGPKLLNTIEQRDVLHHNQFKLISLPLELGVRKQFGKLNMGLNAGFSYNFFLSQKGKSIDAQQEIYAFDDSSPSTKPFKKTFFAFQLNPFFDLKMTDKLKFRLSSTLKYQPQGISGLYDIKQYSIFLGIGGGLVYKL